jgi:hypothetical protein
MIQRVEMVRKKNADPVVQVLWSVCQYLATSDGPSNEFIQYLRHEWVKSCDSKCGNGDKNRADTVAQLLWPVCQCLILMPWPDCCI